MSRFYSGKTFEFVRDFSSGQDALAWIAALVMLLLLGYMIKRML